MSVSKATTKSFQQIILDLQKYWANQGCVILQPYDSEMGAGTSHPSTTLRALGPNYGMPLLYSLAADRQMDVMEKTPTAPSITTNFKLF